MKFEEALKIFEEALKINVNEKTEQKNGLTYLSWAYAWMEFKKIYPDARYEIKRNDDGLPYFYDEKTGYMVFTSIRADGEKHDMWLPVMDANNHAMKSEPYTIRTKYREIRVEAATMFDVNKAVMRCLVINMAMFGLALYIYAGEDLPEDKEEQIVTKKEELCGKVKRLLNDTNSDVELFFDWATQKFGREITHVNDMTEDELEDCKATLERKRGRDNE